MMTMEVLLRNHHGEILQRIAGDQQQIGDKAFLHLAQLVAHPHDLAAEAGGALQRLARRIAQQVDEMLEVAGIVALGRLREAVIAADQRAHAALAQLAIDLAAVVDDPLHADLQRHLMGEAEGLALIERAIDDADGRADEDAVLHRFQHVEGFFIGGFAVIDHVDAAAHRALDGVGGAGMAVDLLAEIAGDLDGGGTSCSRMTVTPPRAMGPRSSPEILTFTLSTPSRQQRRTARAISSAPSAIMPKLS